MNEEVVQFGRTGGCSSGVNVAVSRKAIEGRGSECLLPVVTQQMPAEIGEKPCESPEIEGSNPSLLICPYCGTEVNEYSMKCPICGQCVRCVL